jgi:MoaA/NifB/PqqE/SkfB family radical SAM enzyme
MPLSLPRRVARHARLSARAAGLTDVGTPPFLIFFINSICNLKCEHCFVWDRLNKRDDLSFEEIVALSEDLGPIENLNLSGGEPFMREDFAQVCEQFITRNGVKQIYVPTNGYYTEKTVAAVEAVLENRELDLFVLEFSLDGMPEFHDRFRGNPRSFAKAMETIDAVTEIQRRDARLRIHSIATATSDNLEEIRQLTTYLFERHAAMDHHNIAIIRGDRKNPSLQGPALDAYLELDRYAKRLWAEREQGRLGSVVDPMLTWAKIRTARERQQVIPCKAGILSAVVYANGDVGVCETLASHPVLGNLRERSFREIWHSPEAALARRKIACKECHCTNEVFLWPSVVFQPFQLARALAETRAWRAPEPLREDERAVVAIGEDGLPEPPR